MTAGRPRAYTEENIERVRRLAVNGMSDRKIAEMTGIPKSTVNRILNDQQWKKPVDPGNMT